MEHRNISNSLYNLLTPPLMFPAELAAAIGLHEAILLQHLQFYWNDAGKFEWQGNDHLYGKEGEKWAGYNLQELLKYLPFWSMNDINEILDSLKQKHSIHFYIDPSNTLWYTICQDETEGNDDD